MIVNNKLLVELMIAIAVLAEDILFLALLFYYSVVFSSLSWFGTPSVLLSFHRLSGLMARVVPFQQFAIRILWRILEC